MFEEHDTELATSDWFSTKACSSLTMWTSKRAWKPEICGDEKKRWSPISMLLSLTNFSHSPDQNATTRFFISELLYLSKLKLIRIGHIRLMFGLSKLQSPGNSPCSSTNLFGNSCTSISERFWVNSKRSWRTQTLIVRPLVPAKCKSSRSLQLWRTSSGTTSTTSNSQRCQHPTLPYNIVSNYFCHYGHAVLHIIMDIPFYTFFSISAITWALSYPFPSPLW